MVRCICSTPLADRTINGMNTQTIETFWRRWASYLVGNSGRSQVTSASMKQVTGDSSATTGASPEGILPA
jgi:hypothetical protein